MCLVGASGLPGPPQLPRVPPRAPPELPQNPPRATPEPSQSKVISAKCSRSSERSQRISGNGSQPRDFSQVIAARHPPPRCLFPDAPLLQMPRPRCLLPDASSHMPTPRCILSDASSHMFPPICLLPDASYQMHRPRCLFPYAHFLQKLFGVSRWGHSRVNYYSSFQIYS
jgi:hypothetical protein